MSIEPISSTMAYQATTVVKPAEPVQTETSEDVAARSAEGSIANQQVVVSEVAGADSDGASSGGQGSQQPTDSKNEQVKKAVEEFNKKVLKQNSEAVFGIHEETNRITIKIVDRTSKKVIKELPPEKTLDMIARVWEMAGILVDEKK